MRDTNSSVLDLIGTSHKAASLGLGTMRSTYSSTSGFFYTSLKAALFSPCRVCAMSPTHSTLHGLIRTSLEAASFPRSAMRPTNPSLYDMLGTSLKAASLLYRTMRDANSSLHNLLRTSLKAASLLLLHNCWLDIRLRFFGNHPFLRSLMYLIFTLRTGDRN
jgi:hypothetical protein